MCMSVKEMSGRPEGHILGLYRSSNLRTLAQHSLFPVVCRAKGSRSSRRVSAGCSAAVVQLPDAAPTLPMRTQAPGHTGTPCRAFSDLSGSFPTCTSLLLPRLCAEALPADSHVLPCDGLILISWLLLIIDSAYCLSKIWLWD